jgi:hypothetical protein
MDLTLPGEAVDFAASVRETLARCAPDLRTSRYAHDDVVARRVSDAVGDLGLFDLDVLATQTEAFAAALAAVECGRIAAPIPVAALLTARLLNADEPVHAVGTIPAGGRLLIDHADDRVGVISLDGTYARAAVTTAGRSTRMLAPTAAWVVPEAGISADPAAWAWHEVFSAFASLGAIDAALELTRDHLVQRHQFGKPLASFQALQHRFADALRFQFGLRELANYTLVRVHGRQGDVTADALALRLFHLEALREVFRHAHQSSGAIGFCFEFALPTLTTSVQFRRYAPLTEAQTVAALADRVDRLPSIFGGEAA